MVSCAFLSMADMGGFVSDDELAVALLRERGWRAVTLPWDHPADWSFFDLVVIRSTWDYQQRPQHFLETLEAIDRSSASLQNPLPLVRWNMGKRYLQDLENKGAPVVPTAFAASFTGREALAHYFRVFSAGEIILKPLISANADNTFRISRLEIDLFLPRLETIFAGRPLLVQPFMPSIQVDGEYSLIYFNGKYSHAILKTPAPGDFRVQEEHGGIITAARPVKPLLEAGDRAMAALDPIPLYARVDLVRDDSGSFLIMELELIEPSLYLRMDPQAPNRFVDALSAVLKGAPNI